MSTRQWLHAQAEELACWQGIDYKLRSKSYIEAKKEYWRRILKKAKLSSDELVQQTVLEVGAGPSGIFLLFGNHPSYTTIDPLNDEYKKIAPHLYGLQEVVSDKFEDFSNKRNYQTVFAINCIDHCDDIDLFIRQLARTSEVGGKVIMAVNTHNKRWSQRVWSLFQKVLEPHHPYHFTSDDYQDLLKPYFEIEEVVDIEEEIIWINNKVSNQRLQDEQKKKTVLQKVKSLFSLLLEGELFGRLFILLLEKCGLPSHDFMGKGKSLYRHKMYLMSPKSSR
jgi:SAM-dependent methyltransferase